VRPAEGPELFGVEGGIEHWGMVGAVPGLGQPPAGAGRKRKIPAIDPSRLRAKRFGAQVSSEERT
jgi:hypothetical protein